MTDRPNFDYMILEGFDHADITEQVKVAVGMGWEPLGGCSVVYDRKILPGIGGYQEFDTICIYVQTMVRGLDLPEPL